MTNHGSPAEHLPDSRQVALYGEPWSARLTRLLQAYRISQAKLGSVIGLSAPMVSQLMSGARVKISNPAVYGRIVRLEEMMDAPGVQAGDPTSIHQVLEGITGSTPTLTTVSSPMTPQQPDAATAAVHLAALADAGQLRHLAQTATSIGAASLAEALTRASML